MSIATKPLPENPIDLRGFAAALQAELAARDHEIYAKTLHIEKLKMQLATLRRAQFGRSSEKLDDAIAQIELQLEEDETESAAKQAEACPPETKTAPTRVKMKPVRKSIPAHLPRERVEHKAACTCPNCGSANLTQIGVDEREVLEYVPSHFKAVVHIRPKMSCRACETITQPPMPSLPIERGIPGPSLLARVLVAKYCDHLPLYRQSGIYARDGVDIDCSTLADWVGKMSSLLKPLAEEIVRHVRAGESLYADDTTVPVLDPGRGRTKTGHLWVALRDERPWGSDTPPAVFYHYSPDRKGIRAEELLKGCKGFLHADAYGGFNGLYKDDPKTGAAPLAQVLCWAHARRKIYEVHADTASPAAKELLESIGELFAIEDSIRGKSPDVRLKVRQEHAVPILSKLKHRMEEILGKVSGKGTLAEALRYSVSRWPAFTRYTTDGRLDISNNAAERAIRPLAIGRKNWLFAGADTGGERAAVMYTLIETAKLNGLDPEAYLRDIIDRIADHPYKRIDELLPWSVKL